MKDEIFLFPGTAPGSEAVDIEERIFEEDYEVNYKKLIASGVKKPSIIPFLPEKPDGTAIMVIPGGGYKRQVLNLEGIDIAKWLIPQGITVFVLKHRMPFDGHKEGIHVPLQDAQRGIRLIRKNLKRFNLKPGKIGVMGFSAGGHLASTLGTNFDKQVYGPLDEVDNLSARPDFLVLAYPEISLNAYIDSGYELSVHARRRIGILEEYPTDQMITENTPQTFLVVADDDPVTPPEHCIRFYSGLRGAGIPAELHIYKNGGHGSGLGRPNTAFSGWTKPCEDWINTIVSGE